MKYTYLRAPAGKDTSFPNPISEMKKFRAHSLTVNYLMEPLGIERNALRFAWKMSHVRRGVRQHAYQIQVASSLEQLQNDRPDLWDSGQVVSSLCAHISYEGAPLQSQTTYFWRVRLWENEDQASDWSAAASFETTLDESEWRAAWIVPSVSSGEKAVGVCRDPVHRPPADLSPLMRKRFTLEKPVQRARAYVTGLGYYELFLNGKKVGDHVLDPPYTTYQKRIYYSVYDVTTMLKQGANGVGAMIGQGWWQGPPALLCQIEILFEDGERRHIVSGTDWEWARGPVTENSLYGGESYDARLEIPRWSHPTENPKRDSRWSRVKKARMPRAKLLPQTMPPIRVTQILPAQTFSEPKPGHYIIDFGQNYSGWCRLRLRAPQGTRITLKHAELLYPDGTLNPENLRSAKATDLYIAKGASEEVYAPRFTYHGFRYVQVSVENEAGEPIALQLHSSSSEWQITGDSIRLSLVGEVVHTGFQSRGHFECSNSLLNQIHRNSQWGFRTNYHAVPTDCPQRDERQGWMGDAQMTAEMALYNFTIESAYVKFLRDIQDAQGKDGSVPDTVPFVWGTQAGDPMWSGAYPFIVWDMYRFTGDVTLLREHYAGLKRYVDSLTREAKDGILRRSNYGDWVSVEPTPKELISTGAYLLSARVVEAVAALLDEERDVLKYRALSRKIAKAFHREFYDTETEQYGNGSQFSNAFPLYLQVAPSDLRDAIIQKLTGTITERDNGHLSTGFIGTRYLLDTLTQIGRADLAYHMTATDSYPGWGYTILNGATTIWELWKLETGPGMNSHNHPAFGLVSGWFYSTLAGLRPDPVHPGGEKFLIKPHVSGDLSWAEASFDSMRGEVAVRWEREVGGLTLLARIPANSFAEVWVPTIGLSEPQVFENGKIIWRTGQFLPVSPGVKNGVARGEWIAFEVDSGEYHFEILRG